MSWRQGRAVEDSCSVTADCEVETRPEALRHNLYLRGPAPCETYFLHLAKLLTFQPSPQIVPPTGDQSFKTLDRKKSSYSLHSHAQKGIIPNVCLDYYRMVPKFHGIIKKFLWACDMCHHQISSGNMQSALLSVHSPMN